MNSMSTKKKIVRRGVQVLLFVVICLPIIHLLSVNFDLGIFRLQEHGEESADLLEKISRLLDKLEQSEEVEQSPVWVEKVAGLLERLEALKDVKMPPTLSKNESKRFPITPSRQKDMQTLTTVDIRGLEVCHKTGSRGWEVIFDSLMGTIFREPGFLSEGAVLDVGAQFAEQSCHYGSISPQRKIFTIDPSPSNQQFANTTFAPFMPNMHLIQGGLGSRLGKLRAGKGFFNIKYGTIIPVYTIDSLFIEDGEKLAFAHIDVEGMELQVLKGGVNTIKQDRPVVTTELRVQRNTTYSTELLRFLDSLGYDSYVVNEVCGTPFMDYRNILNIPRELSTRLVHSDVFSLALATEVIYRVDATTMDILEKVYPCCKPGGACCPDPTKVDRPRYGCCSEAAVNQYIRDNGLDRTPVAYKDWANAKKVTEARWKALEARAAVESPGEM